MFKKIMCIALAALMLFALCACGDTAAAPQEGNDSTTTGDFSAMKKDPNADSIKISFIPMSTAQENVPIIEQGIKDAVGDYANVTVTTYDAQFDATTQITLINEAITQGVDGIILQCADAAALNNVIEEAEAAGVLVMTQNIGNTATPTAHMGNSDYKSGWKTAAYVDEMFGGEGNYILLDVAAEIKEACPIGTAFEDYCEENTNFNLLESVSMVTTVENGYTYTRDLLTKYDDIDFIYCANDNQAIGAYQAIKEAGREDEGIALIGFEGQPAALAAIKNGEMTATCYSDPYYVGYAMMVSMMFCIETGINSASLGMGFTPKIELPTTIVDANNIDEVIRLTHWDMSAYNF